MKKIFSLSSLKRFTILTILLIVIFICWNEFNKKSNSAPVEKVETKSIGQDENTNQKNKISVIGSIIAGETISVSAPFDATIKEKKFNFDSMITNGQSLLTLDTGELNIRISEARVALLKSEKIMRDLDGWQKSSEMTRSIRNKLLTQQQVDECERKREEAEELFRKGIIPRTEYDGLVEQLNIHRADLAAANDDLHAVQEKASSKNREIAQIEYRIANKKYHELLALLNEEKIIAKNTGIISKTTAASGQTSPSLDPGSHISRGQVLFTISDVSRLRVTAKVDEIDVLNLEPGLPAIITMDTQGASPIVGKLTEVASQGIQNSSNTRSATFDIVIELPELNKEQQKRLRAGMSCNVLIEKNN